MSSVTTAGQSFTKCRRQIRPLNLRHYGSPNVIRASSSFSRWKTYALTNVSCRSSHCTIYTGVHRLPIPPNAPPALRLGARLDLAYALARQAEDLADVAERQLVVLE